MRKTIIYTIGCLTLFLVAACSEQEFDDKLSTSRELTIIASIPGEQTRIGLSAGDGTLDLITRWNDGEKIQMFAKQDDKVFELEPSYAKNILRDGKLCSFTVHFGDKLDIERPYDLYGLTGVEGYVKDGKTLLAKSRMWRVPTWSQATAPMWFHVTGGYQSTTGPIRVQFEHLGTYEVLHLKNTSNRGVGAAHLDFETNEKWYKSYEESPIPVGSAASATSQSGEYTSSVVFAYSGQSVEFISWYIPSGKPLRDARLRVAMGGIPYTSTNTKSSTIQIQRGHAYHMYATWDGKELKFDGEEPSEQDPVEVIQVDVTKANYYPNHFSHNGKQYSFRYYCTAFVKLNDDTNIQDWGYVYVDPDGNESELISLMPYKSDVGIVGDNRFSYYRDECSSTVKLKGYVKCYGDSEIYYGKEQEFQINYPDETSIAINSCTFQGTTNNVSYLGRTYKYKSTFRYIFSATGAYWMKVGTQVDGPGWSNWTDLPNQTISPVDGSKANALTVSYYYDDKTFTGDYYVFLIATDDTHARSSRTAEYVGYTYSANQFTGCILYGTQNSRLTPVCDIVEGGQSQDNEEPVSDYIINIVSNK